jgi:hypothetical protein
MVLRTISCLTEQQALAMIIKDTHLLKHSSYTHEVSNTGSYVIAGSCPDPIVKSCKFCSEKIEWIGRKPFNYRESSAHRCLGGRQ